MTAGLTFFPIGISNSSGQGLSLHGLVKIYDPEQGLAPGIGGGHFYCFVYSPPPQATVHVVQSAAIYQSELSSYFPPAELFVSHVISNLLPQGDLIVETRLAPESYIFNVEASAKAKESAQAPANFELDIQTNHKSTPSFIGIFILTNKQ